LTLSTTSEENPATTARDSLRRTSQCGANGAMDALYGDRSSIAVVGKAVYNDGYQLLRREVIGPAHHYIRQIGKLTCLG